MDPRKAYLLYHLGMDVTDNCPAVSNKINEVKVGKTNTPDCISSSILTPATLDYLRSLKVRGIISDDLFTEMVLKAAKGHSEDTQTICKSLTSDDLVTEDIAQYLNEKLKTGTNINQSEIPFNFKTIFDQNSSEDSVVTASMKEDDVCMNTTAKYCIPSTSKEFIMLYKNHNYAESTSVTNTDFSTSVSKNSVHTALIEKDNIGSFNWVVNYVLKCYRHTKFKIWGTKSNPKLNTGHDYIHSLTDDACSFYSARNHTLNTAITKDDGDVALEKNLSKCYRQTTLSRCSSNETFYSAIMKEDDDDEVTLEKNLPKCYRQTTAREFVLETNSYRNDQCRFCMSPKVGLSKSLPNIYFTLQRIKKMTNF